MIPLTVKEWLTQEKARGESRVFAFACATQLRISVDEAETSLYDLARDGLCTLAWHVYCPDPECRSRVLHDRLPEYGTILSCHKCGYEFELSENDCEPVFLLKSQQKAS